MSAEELRRLAAGPVEAAMDAALRCIDDADRNIRVLSLRILGRGTGEKGSRGILAGLADPKRRVREVAIKCSGPYLDRPQVVERLKQIVEDEEEKLRIRSQALHALGGHYPLEGASPYAPEAAIRALANMAEADEYRSAVLWRVLQMELTPPVEQLLRRFVKEGTREEAVSATRALCGYWIVNIGAFGGEERRRIIQTSDRAAGQVFYWVRRPESP